NPESPTGRLHRLLRLALQPRREPRSKSRLTQSARLEPTSQRSSEYPNCPWWRRTERKPLPLTLVVAHNLLPRIPGWLSYLSVNPSRNPRSRTAEYGNIRRFHRFMIYRSETQLILDS